MSWHENNYLKSHVINIEDGELAPKYLTVYDAAVISPVIENDSICYLEANFKDEIVLDQKQFLLNLENNFRNIITLRAYIS